jgi:uncharacterized protein involved in outer membrane biogenesis
MNTKRKVFLGFAGAFGLVAALLAALFALAPWWLRLEPVKAKILSDASRTLGGSVGYASLELSYFPRPQIVFRRLELSIPGKALGMVNPPLSWSSFCGGYPNSGGGTRFKSLP